MKASKIIGGLLLGAIACVTAAPTGESATTVSEDATAVASAHAAASAAIHKTYSKAVVDINDQIKQLASDPDGLVHLADDGVMRAYAGNGTVIDFLKLSNFQLRAYLKAGPYFDSEHIDHLHEVFENVDGYDQINDTEIWNPTGVNKWQGFASPSTTQTNDVEGTPVEFNEKAAAATPTLLAGINGVFGWDDVFEYYPCHMIYCQSDRTCDALDCGRCLPLDLVITGDAKCSG